MFEKMKARHRRRHGERMWSHGSLNSRENAEHGGGPRRHRRRRLFDQGDLRFIILGLIAQKPRHGYDIIKEIEDSFAGAYSPSPGVIYPTLTLLEDMGLASQTAGEAGRKLYTITPEGVAYLQDNRTTVEEVEQRLSQTRASFKNEPVEIEQALQNLKSALDNRLSRALDKEAAASITNTINQAVGEIEKT